MAFCDQFDPADIETCFKWLDKDGNGVVDKKDFSEVVRESGQVASDKASLKQYNGSMRRVKPLGNSLTLVRSRRW